MGVQSSFAFIYPHMWLGDLAHPTQLKWAGSCSQGCLPEAQLSSAQWAAAVSTVVQFIKVDEDGTNRASYLLPKMRASEKLLGREGPVGGELSSQEKSSDCGNGPSSAGVGAGQVSLPPVGMGKSERVLHPPWSSGVGGH